jgi:release factor glutamine methyltransferase
VVPDNSIAAVSPPETVGDALAAAALHLRTTSDTARLDAEVLLAHVMGRDRSWLLAHPEAPLEEATAFDAAIERRAAGEPVAYIRGFKEWRSLRIRTDARALIPRPETELVVDAAVAEIAERLARGDERIVAWDLATGSGAIAVALALRFRQALTLGRVVLVASDASPEALELASENLAAHGVETLVQLALADLLAPAGAALHRPDVLTANLPYVSSAEVDERVGSLGFEPRIALDGGEDGLDLLRRLMGELPERTTPGATAFLELGVGQAPVIEAMAPGATVTVVPDLAGLDRVVRIGLPA